jgi:outer membrane biosynthesis protein TonB
MRLQAIAGFLAVLAVSGCASPKAPPTAIQPPAAQVAEPPPAQMQSTAQPPQPTPQTPPPSPTPTQLQTPPQSQPPQLPPSAAPRSTAAPVAAAKKPPLEASSPPSAAPPSASPTLNLADLEQRLRDTRAIGVFTKLSLKNQVDDLLDAFRALYRGPDKRPPAALRQRYDLLLLKVLSLLQDVDPSLASAIQSSREAIWSILADPYKFSKI